MTQITCHAIGLYTSPVQHSTMGHIVLDLTSLVCQPKSRERSDRPTKHVTFALSEGKSGLDDDEDDKPLVRSNRTTVSEDEDEDNKTLVQPASGKNSWNVNLRQYAEFLHRYGEKRTSSPA